MCEKNQHVRDRTKRYTQLCPALWRRRAQNEQHAEGGDPVRGHGVLFHLAGSHRLACRPIFLVEVWLHLLSIPFEASASVAALADDSVVALVEVFSD